MDNNKPPVGVKPYYVNVTERMHELCEAIIRQTELPNFSHNKIKLWCHEIMLLNEMERVLRYEDAQKTWSEDKDGMLHEMR